MPETKTGPKYYEFDGFPARRTAPNRLPEVLRSDGWRPYYDAFKFDTEADLIDEDEFRDMVQEAGGPEPEDKPEKGDLTPEQIQNLGKQLADGLGKDWRKFNAGRETNLSLDDDFDDEEDDEWLEAIVMAFDDDIELAQVHSPEGGVTLFGTFYPGGRFLPNTSEAMKEAKAAAAAAGLKGMEASGRFNNMMQEYHDLMGKLAPTPAPKQAEKVAKTLGRAPVAKPVAKPPRLPKVVTPTPASESVSLPPTPENPTDASAGNFRYSTRDFVPKGLKSKFRANVDAIKTLQAIKLEGRDTATPEEQEIMSRYIGWGQFPALFNDYTSAGREWNKEREELKSLITPEEWTSARKSILNAHYTDPSIVDAHWKMAQKMGFKGGRFLETSAGIGYYLGMMPDELKGKTHASAVEKDSLSGGMLQKLYPAAKPQVQGFEEHQAPDNFYDLIASNVPFGDYGVADPRYDKHQANIHDYFFLKSAHLAKPGGLIMHITSTGTMDKADSKIRAELTKTCDLVSAVRFPGQAHKEGAGTDVVTDMIVLRKRHPGEQPVSLTETPDEADAPEGFTGITTDSLGRLYHWKDGKRVPGPDWTDITTVPDPAGGEPIPVNKYFADNPEQILGTLDRTGTQYGADQKNVSRAEDYEERLQAAIDRLPSGVMRKTAAPSDRFEPKVMPAPGDVKVGGYLVKDGTLFIRHGGGMEEQKVNAKVLARIQGQLEIRDALREVINAQLKGEDATAGRAKLNTAYDAFVAKYGYLSERVNENAMGQDPDGPVLLSLEKFDSTTGKAVKKAIFTKDTIRSVAKVDKANNVAEGLGVSLHETGGVDVDRIAQLTGQTVEQVGQELVAKGIAFQDPSQGWKPADQYLSGNVRRKLVLAKAAAAVDPKFAPNVAALEKVQPEDIDVANGENGAEVKLGAPWVPPSDIAAFASHLLNIRAEHFAISHVSATGQWMADVSSKGKAQLERTQTALEQWSTPRKAFKQLFEAALNNKQVTVMDTDSDGNSYVNKDATADANAKVTEIKEAFQGWLWNDDERRDRLHRYYNDNFNNIRTIHYDGSHQTFPGMNPDFKPHKHIGNFVWQVVTTGRGLAAHEVGTGKTAAMIMSAMELRRLGLVRKPAIACLKANVEQITQEALNIYPGAKIISTAGMFDAKKRRETIAAIATGDYDMIIMTHDHLGLMRMKPGTLKTYIDGEIAELEAAKAKAAEADPSKGNRVVKDLQKAKERLEATLKKALDDSKKDNAVFFEETGIDHLFVDEAHKFKTLPVYSGQGRIKGVPNGRSDKATAMQMRTRWLMEKNGGRGVVFATGTPVANTMAELYNVQRYLQPDILKEHGLESFDAWSNVFGDVSSKMEFTVAGDYKSTSRFRGFSNVNELMQMARQVMDVQRVDDLPPKLDKETGKMVPAISRPARKDNIVKTPETEKTKAFMQTLVDRAKNIGGGRAQKGEDNMLVICSDGRKYAVDPRLIDANAPDDPDSKTNMAVRNVLQTLKDNPGKTQIIFSNVGVHPMKAKAKKAKPETAEDRVAGGKLMDEIIEGQGGGTGEESDEDEPKSEEQIELERLAAGDTRFHLYEDIISKLVRGGIPREKIADFSVLKGAKKEAAMAAMKRGDVLVALGSTEKLGTGVNVQDKLIALHHLDVPWQPAEVEQRDGRAYRHGNQNKDIAIHRYVAEGSLDKLFWQIIDTKTKGIRQVMTNDGKVDGAMKEDDSEEISPARLMAVASGDPRVMEKVNLEEDVKQLRGAEMRHHREQARQERAVKSGEEKASDLHKLAQRHEADAKHLTKQPDFSFMIDGKTYDKRPDAEEALATRVRAIKEVADNLQPWQRYDLDTTIGEYRGLPVSYEGGKLVMSGTSGQTYESGDSLKSLEAIARGITKKHTSLMEDVARAKADLEKAKASGKKTFAKSEELKTKQERLKALERELSGKTEDEDASGAGDAKVAKRAERMQNHVNGLVKTYEDDGRDAAQAEYARIVNEFELSDEEKEALRAEFLKRIAF